MQVLELDPSMYERFFVVGGLKGNYSSLIGILYEQHFTYNDCLILTGNFVDIEAPEVLELLVFLKNNYNCYSVIGYNEVNLLNEYEQEELPEIFSASNSLDFVNYLYSLPLLIKIKDYLIVNAGLEPHKKIEEQAERVFYSITDYDEDSRYYQFFNPEKESWYRFSFSPYKICFTNSSLEDFEVEAGYNLGCITSNLRCLVISKYDTPEVVEMVSETKYYNI